MKTVYHDADQVHVLSVRFYCVGQRPNITSTGMYGDGEKLVWYHCGMSKTHKLLTSNSESSRE